MKKYILHTIITIILTGTAALVSGQSLGYKHLVSIDAPSISPALSGYSGNVAIFADLYKKWMGIDGSPEHLNLNISGPAYKELSGKLNISQIKTGNFITTESSFSIADKIKLTNNSNLFFGISANYSGNRINPANTNSLGNDPVLMQAKLKTNRLFFGAGVTYQYLNFDVGLFSHNLTGIYLTNAYMNNESITAGLHISYNHKINNSQKIKTVLIAETIPKNLLSSTKYQADIIWDWEKRFFAGLSLRTDKTIGITGGASIADNILLFYSYQIGLSPIASYSSGSHLVKFAFLIKRKKTTTIFPISDKEKEMIHKEDIQKKSEKELKELKEHFNKTLYEYEKRIKELEDKK